MYLRFLNAISLNSIYAQKGENDRVDLNSILEMSLWIYVVSNNTQSHNWNL